ncbi:MAG TPA: FkbM family methyltransferase [Symbiobacteriaceae bacterium]|jgi:FkbM family methyltransferase
MFPFTQTSVVLNGVPLTMLHHENAVVGGLLRSGRVSSEVLDFLSRVIEPGSRVLDAGANIGSTALFLAKVEPTATIYCFEPDPLNFSLLNLNIALNQVPRVYTFNFALGQEERLIQLYRNGVNHGDHRSSPPMQTDMDAPRFRPLPVPVQMVNPTDFFRRMGGDHTASQFDLVKIDTQGADFAILEACLPLLHANSTVVVEYSPYHLYRNGTQKEDVERIAGRFSSMEILTPMGNPQRTDPVTMDLVLASYDTYSREWIGHSDLVFKQLKA